MQTGMLRRVRTERQFAESSLCLGASVTSSRCSSQDFDESFGDSSQESLQHPDDAEPIGPKSLWPACPKSMCAPYYEVLNIAVTSGAMSLAALSGLLGMATGAVLGGVVGSALAFLTFGVSVPVCAAFSASTGLITGVVVGIGAGAIGGGALGFGAYVCQVETREVTQGLKATALGSVKSVTYMRSAVGSQAQSFMSSVAHNGATAGFGLMTSPSSAKLSTSTLVGGIAGAVTGIAVGGIWGTLLGMVLAIFTFGLSIPLGACVGSGLGLCAGTILGGSFGAVGSKMMHAQGGQS